MSAQAAAEICGGRLTGAELGATELSFYPGHVRAGRYNFDVGAKAGSAGSVSLILQTVFSPLGFAQSSSKIGLKGGTHVPWSPSADYIHDVFIPTVASMGLKAKLEVPVCGFYPVGGGVMNVTIDPLHHPLKPLWIKERGGLKRLWISSAVANLPLSIADRQLNHMVRRLAEYGLTSQGKSLSVASPGKGTFCFILAQFDCIRAGFSAIGAIGKRAEQVADEAAEAFIRFQNRSGALDSHLADQIVPLMAIAEGQSAVSLSTLTDHLRTNIWVVEQFLPAKFVLSEGPDGKEGDLMVTGVGLRTD